jgi:spermidine synthase
VGRSVVSDASRLATLDDANALFPTLLPRRISGVVLFGSGFATLAYEIVWFRALGYLFGNSAYAFTIMLVVFLLGLGFGGVLCGRERWRLSPERNLAFCQLGIAVLAMIAIAAETIVLADRQLSSSISIFSGVVRNLPWWQRLLTDLCVGLALLLPATLLMGFSFPLATRLYLGDLRWLGKRVGGAYLLASLGSIAGSVAAALLILPYLGTIDGTRAIAALNAMLGFLVLSWLPWPMRRRLAWCLGTLAVVWSMSLLLPARLPFRAAGKSGSLQVELLFEEEGDISTVQVWASRDHPERRWIAVDGTPIGEARGLSEHVYGKQILLAHLPMALDPGVRRTLNIGLGSASTLHTLASYPTVQELDAVEISGAVARGSRLFDESEVLADPRVRLVVEDISHFLLQETKRYDLIISDGKLAADFSGNAMMLSRDFYAYASRRLSERGLFIQWIPLNHTREDFEVILRTFLGSFPEVELFFEDPGSVFLVGSRWPISGRRGPGAEGSATERMKQDLASLRIPRVDALLARWAASGTELREIVGEGRINTWDHSVIDYSIYRSTMTDRRRSIGSNLTLILDANALTNGNPFIPPGSPFEISTALGRSARSASYRRQFTRARQLAERAVKANEDDQQAMDLLREFRSSERRWKRRGSRRATHR